MRKLIVGACIAALFAAGVAALLKYDEWFVLPELRAHVVRALKNPQSAQFRNERLTESGWLCGEVSAKNSMGEYVEFKRFAVRSNEDAYLEGEGYIGLPADFAAYARRKKQRLDIQIAISKQRTETRTATGTRQPPLSEHDLKDMIDREVFERKWKDVCA